MSDGTDIDVCMTAQGSPGLKVRFKRGRRKYDGRSGSQRKGFEGAILLALMMDENTITKDIGVLWTLKEGRNFFLKENGPTNTLILGPLTPRIV